MDEALIQECVEACCIALGGSIGSFLGPFFGSLLGFKSFWGSGLVWFCDALVDSSPQAKNKSNDHIISSSYL